MNIIITFKDGLESVTQSIAACLAKIKGNDLFLLHKITYLLAGCFNCDKLNRNNEMFSTFYNQISALQGPSISPEINNRKPRFQK